MRSWGCLVFLIPITICTVVPPLFVMVVVMVSLIRNAGKKMGPTDQSLTYGMLCFVAVINIPTILLWWTYFSAPKPPESESE